MFRFNDLLVYFEASISIGQSVSSLWQKVLRIVPIKQDYRSKHERENIKIPKISIAELCLFEFINRLKFGLSLRFVSPEAHSKYRSLFANNNSIMYRRSTDEQTDGTHTHTHGTVSSTFSKFSYTFPSHLGFRSSKLHSLLITEVKEKSQSRSCFICPIVFPREKNRSIANRLTKWIVNSIVYFENFCLDFPLKQ